MPCSSLPSNAVLRLVDWQLSRVLRLKTSKLKVTADGLSRHPGLQQSLSAVHKTSTMQGRRDFSLR